MKPTLRKDVEIDLASAIMSQIRRADIHPFRNCLNCVQWNKDDETCKQFKARPPATVICYGCSEHFDVNEIPF